MRSDAAIAESAKSENVRADDAYRCVAGNGTLQKWSAVETTFGGGTVSVADSTDNSTSLQQGPDADSMVAVRSPGLAR